MDEEAGIAAVTAIQLERLKFHEMASAQASAKKIEAGTSEDVINMLTGEAKDRISESLQEKREEAKERAEEKGKEEGRGAGACHGAGQDDRAQLVGEGLVREPGAVRGL